MHLVTSDLFAKLPRLPSILRVGAAARTPLHRNLRADFHRRCAYLGAAIVCSAEVF